MSLRSVIEEIVEREGCFNSIPFLRTHPEYSYQEVRDVLLDLMQEEVIKPLDSFKQRFSDG